MKTFITAVLLTCASLSAAGPARAEAPLFLPTRDVSVTYRLIGGTASAPREAHMFFSAATQKIRLDQASQKGYAVIDRATKTVLVVVTGRQQYASMPFDDEMASGFILNDRMHFARAGSDTVAGLHCTTWSVQSARAAGSVCVTDDGVLLRGKGTSTQGTVSGLEAVAVSYEAQPAALFAPPAGYTLIPPEPPAQPTKP
jgi:hypothetical protein